MPNDEAKRDERRARLLGAAEKAERRAEQLEGAARRLVGMIPLGQPILVGHHSEKRARRDAERIRSGYDRARAEREKALELRRRASGVGRAGVSSDDSEAVEKLRAKIEEFEGTRAKRKDVNAAFRRGGWDAVGALLGWDPSMIARWKAFDEKNGASRVVYPAYSLANLSAKIRDVKKRIAVLEREAARPEDEPVRGAGWDVSANKGDHRVRIRFDERQGPEVLGLLRRQGFRWAPSLGVWQRHLNEAGRAAARVVVEALAAKEKK